MTRKDEVAQLKADLDAATATRDRLTVELEAASKAAQEAYRAWSVADKQYEREQLQIKSAKHKLTDSQAAILQMMALGAKLETYRSFRSSRPERYWINGSRANAATAKLLIELGYVKRIGSVDSLGFSNGDDYRITDAGNAALERYSQREIPSR